MRNFIITYAPIQKFGKMVTRNTKIIVSKPAGNIGIDAKAAVGIFINSIGSLKKNKIIEIQEIDENNKPIGEVIKPMNNTSIIPTGR